MNGGCLPAMLGSVILSTTVLISLRSVRTTAVRPLQAGADRGHSRPMELLFVLFAVLVLALWSLTAVGGILRAPG